MAAIPKLYRKKHCLIVFIAAAAIFCSGVAIERFYPVISDFFVIKISYAANFFSSTKSDAFEIVHIPGTLDDNVQPGRYYQTSSDDRLDIEKVRARSPTNWAVPRKNSSIIGGHEMLPAYCFARMRQIAQQDQMAASASVPSPQAGLN